MVSDFLFNFENFRIFFSELKGGVRTGIHPVLIKETLIGQKSIKVGLLELKLRVCFSSPLIVLGLKVPLLFGRFSTRTKCLNLVPGGEKPSRVDVGASR